MWTHAHRVRKQKKERKKSTIKNKLNLTYICRSFKLWPFFWLFDFSWAVAQSRLISWYDNHRVIYWFLLGKWFNWLEVITRWAVWNGCSNSVFFLCNSIFSFQLIWLEAAATVFCVYSFRNFTIAKWKLAATAANAAAECFNFWNVWNILAFTVKLRVPSFLESITFKLLLSK